MDTRFTRRRGLGVGLLGFLLLLLLACQGVSISLGDETAAPTPNLAATAAVIAAQTMQAQAQPSPTGPGQATQVLAATATVAAPTVPPSPTPVPSPTATPVPTATPAPAVTLTANGNLRCREGPGAYYPEVAMLTPGDTVAVVGHAEEMPEYWQVRLDDGRTCWVWERYASLEGDVAAVPTVTPPPAPDAAFSLYYAGYSECASSGLTFQIVNRGPVPIESFYIEVHDGALYTATAGLKFTWWLDCVTSGSAGTILPGKNALITVNTGLEDLRGHTVQIKAKACTEDNLNGTCFERTFTITP